jgi:hypothetical protein
MEYTTSSQSVDSQVPVSPDLASGELQKEVLAPPPSATPDSSAGPPASVPPIPTPQAEGDVTSTAPSSDATSTNGTLHDAPLPVESPAPVATDVDAEAVPPEELAQVTRAEEAELPLTDRQRLALVALRKSPSRTMAAAAAQVSRMQLWRWMNQDPAFKAAQNAWKQDIIETGQGQLLAGTRDAVQTVLRAAREDPKYAWKLLEAQGMLQPPKPGSTDVQTIAAQQADERRIESIKRKRLKAKLDMAELQADVLAV